MGCRLAFWSGLRHFPCRAVNSSGSIRARSSWMLARPYIARLSVFSLLIWPSACPLLHFSVTAFLTASRSRLRVRENCCMEGIPERRASSISTKCPSRNLLNHVNRL
jgi:hypothetical protein